MVEWINAWTNNSRVDVKYSALSFLLGHALVTMDVGHCIKDLFLPPPIHQHF